MDANETILYDDGHHKCIMFSFDDETHEDAFLSINQYLIIQEQSAILIDPGSASIYYEVYDAVAKHIDPQKLKYIFFSHQDPDVAGSIAEWSISTSAKLVVSALWVRFMSHYGLMDMSRIVALNDKGARLNFGSDALQFIPAHFLHSPGNFSLYDSRSKILFSGDIGAAVVPATKMGKEIEDFEQHLPHLEGFHKRYMGSNKLARAWVDEVEKLHVDIIAPQHGALFRELHVNLFLEWFKALECGSDLVAELYSS
jgi:flavorubredoxin